MSEETREGIGVNGTTLSTFVKIFKCNMELLSGKIDVMSDKVPASRRMTREQLTKPYLVIGPPGIGKTAILSGMAKRLTEEASKDGRNIRFGFKTLKLGDYEIGTLTGVPMFDQEKKKIVKFQPDEFPNVERDGEYGILLLDEITTADSFQILPALGLTDDTRRVSNYVLPPNWIVVAAGNGPECRNFVRLDDMLISRFITFDINYSYKEDFRSFAETSHVHPLVIAYLDFKPDDVLSVKSTEYDKAGKAFPCPRSWFDLSILIKQREAFGTVTADDLAVIAGSKIGKETALKFAAFYRFKESLVFDVDKIFTGRERMPSEFVKLPEEQFFIIMQYISARFKDLLEEDSVNPTYSVALLTQSTHAINWILDFGKIMLDRVLLALIRLTRTVKGTQDLLTSHEFEQYCPQLNRFFEVNAEAFAKIDITRMGG